MQVGAAGPDFGSAPGPSRYPRVSSPINDQSVLGGNDECVQCPRQRGPLRGQPGQQVPVDPSARPCWYAYWACQPRARRAASGAPSIPGGPGSWRCCGNLRRWPWSPAHFRSPRWCRPAGRSARWAAGSDCDCGTGATARNAADQGLRQVVGLGLRQVVRLVETHWDGIVGWHDSRISNGLLEGTNSLIEAAKARARARGYRSNTKMTTVIYVIAGKLPNL